MPSGSGLPLFPILAGPTASGKSAVAVELALLLRDHYGLDGEVVTADSIQVYRGLDIGSAKPTPSQRRGIVHHLIDIADPTGGEPFTVDSWLELAEHTIADCRSRGVVPIVVGGTHLYVKALLEGLFEGPPPDPALRRALEALDPAARRAELERVDPPAAARIHPRDARRTVRALEVHRLTGRPISQWQEQWDSGRVRQDCLLVVLDWPREVLNQRINARVKEMMAAGLLDEVRQLHAAGRLGPQAQEALGYKQLLEHLQGRGKVGLEDAVERIKIETRRFAKNQRTWIRRLAARPPHGGLLQLDMSALSPGDCAQLIASKLLTGIHPAAAPPDSPLA